jgi:hypothetical protein
MLRACYTSVFVVAALFVADVPSADAAPVSMRNPYRSFNISGVNYGSMRWERAHRTRRQAANRFEGRFFRRR